MAAQLAYHVNQCVFEVIVLGKIFLDLEMPEAKFEQAIDVAKIDILM